MAKRWNWGWIVLAAGLAGCVAAPWPVAAQPAPAPVVEAAPVREQLAGLLQRMTGAISAADQEGYLACVSMADPCFATEQRNWAKDLGRAVPEHFEVVLTDAEVTTASDGAAEAKVRMAWRMPEGRERSLSYTARFVRAETGWLYAGEKWNVVEGDRIRIYFEGDLTEAARHVAEVLPGVRAHVHEGFQLEHDRDLTERVQEVKLYSGMRHLQQSIYLSYKDALSGWNEPGESIKILANPGTGKGALRTLLAHEYGHVATFQLGPKATGMPWWVLEGAAELSAQEYSRDWASVEGMVRRWASRGSLVDWDRLADFHGEATQHMGHVYNQGHHMVAYISDKFGRDRRNAWLRNMAEGQSIDDASRGALGRSFAELDLEWRRSIAPKPKDEPAEIR